MVYIGAKDWEKRKAIAQAEAKRIEEELRQKQISEAEAIKKLQEAQSGGRYNRVDLGHVTEKIRNESLKKSLQAQIIEQRRAKSYRTPATQFGSKLQTEGSNINAIHNRLVDLQREAEKQAGLSQGQKAKDEWEDKAEEFKRQRETVKELRAEAIKKGIKSRDIDKILKEIEKREPKVRVEVEKKEDKVKEEKPIKKEFGGVSIKAEPKKKKSFVEKLYLKSVKTEYKAQKVKGFKRQAYSLLSAGYSFIGAFFEPVRHPVKFVKGITQTVIHPVKAIESLGTELKERPAGVVGRIAGYRAFGKLASKGIQKGVGKIASTKQSKIEAIKSTKIVRVPIEEGKAVSVLETEAKIKVGKVTYDVKGAGVEVSRDIGQGRYLDIGAIKYLLKKETKLPTKTYKGVQTLTGVTKVEDTGFKGVMQFRTSIKLDDKYAYQTGVTGFLGEVYAYDEIGPRYAYAQFIKTSAKGVTEDLTKTMVKDVKPIDVRISEAKPSGIGAGLTRQIAKIGEKEYFQTISKEVYGKKALASFEKIGKDFYKDISSQPGGTPSTPPGTSAGLKTVEVPPATPLTQTFQQTAKQFASTVYSKEAGAKVGLVSPKVTGITSLKQEAPLVDVKTKDIIKPTQAEEQIIKTVKITDVKLIGKQDRISVLKSDVKKIQEVALGKKLEISPTTKQAQAEIQQQAQQQKQITKQQQVQQQKQTQKQITKQQQKIKQISAQPTDLVSLPPVITSNVYAPSLIPTIEPIISKGRYQVEVRRRGMFRPVGIFKSPREAFLKGKTVVQMGAGASLRVRPVDGPQNLFSVASKILPSKIFRRSEKEPGVYIQRRQFRISTAGEKGEITYRGLAKLRQMGKKKSIFNMFG